MAFPEFRKSFDVNQVSVGDDGQIRMIFAYYNGPDNDGDTFGKSVDSFDLDRRIPMSPYEHDLKSIPVAIGKAYKGEPLEDGRIPLIYEPKFMTKGQGPAAEEYVREAADVVELSFSGKPLDRPDSNEHGGFDFGKCDLQEITICYRGATPDTGVISKSWREDMRRVVEEETTTTTKARTVTTSSADSEPEPETEQYQPNYMAEWW